MSSFRKFFASLALLALCGTLAVFALFAARSRHLMHDQMLGRARAELDAILLVRRWNSEHGGVWVEKRPGVESSPYLASPDLVTTDGRVLTHRNHAIMTREIAELSRGDGRPTFHLTSLNPFNPANRPDPREREALLALQRGEKERYWTERTNDRTTFRYMRPLLVEPSCLSCHGSQGYGVGEVRGGVTVAFDIGRVERRMATDIVVTAGAGVLAFLALIGPIAFLVKRLRGQLKELRRQLEAAATTDALTGLANRRQFMERFAEELDRHLRLGRTLGFILLDLDHFKEINDSLGHTAGDQVLREAAALARQAVRPYDIVGRYGGDELTVLLPEADIDLAADVGERLRVLVAGRISAGSAQRAARPVTISLGVTCSRNPDDELESIVNRADEALYRAKQSGRNRLETMD